MKKSKLCRPPKGATDIHMWTGRSWKPYNGKPATAFSYKSHDGGYPCAGAVDMGTLMSRAMNYTGRRWMCANGKILPALRQARRKSK